MAKKQVTFYLQCGNKLYFIVDESEVTPITNWIGSSSVTPLSMYYNQATYFIVRDKVQALKVEPAPSPLPTPRPPITFG